MSDLSSRIGNLPPEKRSLLEQRLLQRRSGRGEEPIPRRAPGERVPLSFSQQRLWFLDQWTPGAPTYNAALPLRVRGPLDVEALRSAIETVVERHEALRTVFVAEQGHPEQKVLEDWRFELPVLDLRELPESERKQEARRLLRERTRRPFDLRRDLMLRATLLRLEEEEWILNFEEHHIAFDGWSDAIMFRELEELYAARIQRRQAELAELSIQYADYTLWQRRRMEGELLEEHLAYWRRQLASAPTTLRLRTDRSRPAVQTFEGAHLHLELSADLAEGVRALARAEAATPYMMLLAAFATLLYRLTGQDDLLVGTPMANRGRLELEGLIGFFSNTVALRVRLGGNPSFRELVRRVREVALGAFAHQECPFEKIVEAVRPVRDPAVNPLFQVNFRAQTGGSDGPALAGLELEPVTIDVGFSRFDLALELQLHEDAIRGYLEYNLELFGPETAERIASDFAQLLRDVLADPDAPLLALRLRSAADRVAAPVVRARAMSIASRTSRSPRSATSPTRSEE